MVSLRLYPSSNSSAASGREDYINVDTDRIRASAGRGSTGNVLAALASFFVPGLGQIIQGRLVSAIFLFVATSIGYALWFLILPGILAFLLHVAAVVDAATWSEN